MHEKKLLSVLRETKINIERALCVSLDKSWGFNTLGSPFSRIYIVGRGGGFLKVGNRTLAMKAGNMYFIPAHTPFSCGCEDMEKIFFHVSVTALERYDLFSGLDGIYSLPFSVDDYSDLKALLVSESYLDILEIKSRVLKIIVDFCKSCEFRNFDIKKYSPLVGGVMDYVESNTRINLSVSDIANHFFVSASKVRNAFKSELGIPLGKYIDDMVFIKAMLLLSNKDLSVADVSAQLGFCDQFYFSRRFKEKYGVIPREFKLKNAF